MDFGHFAGCLLAAFVFGLLALVMLRSMLSEMKTLTDSGHTWGCFWYALACPLMLCAILMLWLAWGDLQTGLQHFRQLL